MPKSGQNIDTPQGALFAAPDLGPGSCDDDAIIRGLVTDAIRKSPSSREEIAECMSGPLSQKVTVSQLNTYTAESKEKHRWPLCWTRAFCEATGDFRLITVIAERAGFIAIPPQDQPLLELGRQYLTRKLAEENVARLEAELRRRA